jgi:glycosyltransferase involved in cell wall biosynthesis
VPPDAGILVAPDDVAALAGALRRLISSNAERERLAAAARAAASALPTWQDSAKLFAAAIEAAA